MFDLILQIWQSFSSDITNDPANIFATLYHLGGWVPFHYDTMAYSAIEPLEA
jgi:hypothetical protein